MKIEDFRAISIKQPWIDLILNEIKTIEVRYWEVKRRGPIILHASRSIDWKTTHLLNYHSPLNLGRGCLIGYAEIENVIKFTNESWIQNFESHRVVHPMIGEAWGLVLKNVKLFEKPITHKGKRYFFPIEHQKLSNLEKQLNSIINT